MFRGFEDKKRNENIEIDNEDGSYQENKYITSSSSSD